MDTPGGPALLGLLRGAELAVARRESRPGSRFARGSGRRWRCAPRCRATARPARARADRSPPSARSMRRSPGQRLRRGRGRRAGAVRARTRRAHNGCRGPRRHPGRAVRSAGINSPSFTRPIVLIGAKAVAVMLNLTASRPAPVFRPAVERCDGYARRAARAPRLSAAPPPRRALGPDGGRGTGGARGDHACRRGLLSSSGRTARPALRRFSLVSCRRAALRVGLTVSPHLRRVVRARSRRREGGRGASSSPSVSRLSPRVGAGSISASSIS